MENQDKPEKTQFIYDDITHAIAYGHRGAKDGLTHHQTLVNYKEANNIKYVSAVEEDITLPRQELKNILHCATGNIKDFAMSLLRRKA